MELDEIEVGVQTSVRQFLALQEMKKHPLELTNGAINLIINMIVNIEKDPSPYWEAVEVDAVQRFAISTIPNVLADMNNRYKRDRWDKYSVSSWEILHDISDALNKWCPIPKDI